jgi:hypothetical protein
MLWSKERGKAVVFYRHNGFFVRGSSPEVSWINPIFLHIYVLETSARFAFFRNVVLYHHTQYILSQQQAVFCLSWKRVLTWFGFRYCSHIQNLRAENCEKAKIEAEVCKTVIGNQLGLVRRVMIQCFAWTKINKVPYLWYLSTIHSSI